MSLIYLLGAVYLFQNNIPPSDTYFIEWALFGMADALMFRKWV